MTMEYIILVLSLFGIVFGADYLVSGAVSIARRYKVSDFVIGAAIVGIGTSMPELVVSFIGALQGNADVAIGNVIGSNIFNITWILGLSSQVMPLNSSGITAMDYIVMIAAAVIPMVLGFKGRINRFSGALMFIGFIAYTLFPALPSRLCGFCQRPLP